MPMSLANTRSLSKCRKLREILLCTLPEQVLEKGSFDQVGVAWTLWLHGGHACGTVVVQRYTLASCKVSSKGQTNNPGSASVCAEGDQVFTLHDGSAFVCVTQR
jgi:hypothetical protein